MINDYYIIYHENEIYNNYRNNKKVEMNMSISSGIELWRPRISDDLEIRQSRNNCVDKEFS